MNGTRDYEFQETSVTIVSIRPTLHLDLAIQFYFPYKDKETNFWIFQRSFCINLCYGAGYVPWCSVLWSSRYTYFSITPYGFDTFSYLRNCQTIIRINRTLDELWYKPLECGVLSRIIKCFGELIRDSWLDEYIATTSFHQLFSP